MALFTDDERIQSHPQRDGGTHPALKNGYVSSVARTVVAATRDSSTGISERLLWREVFSCTEITWQNPIQKNVAAGVRKLIHSQFT
jgi:hypothetical protein